MEFWRTEDQVLYFVETPSLHGGCDLTLKQEMVDGRLEVLRERRLKNQVSRSLKLPLPTNPMVCFGKVINRGKMGKRIHLSVWACSFGGKDKRQTHGCVTFLKCCRSTMTPGQKKVNGKVSDTTNWHQTKPTTPHPESPNPHKKSICCDCNRRAAGGNGASEHECESLELSSQS